MSDPVCALPTPAPEAEAALAGVRTIAVVGLSPQPERPSHQVASYLQSAGFRIIPIRPGVAEILGERAYPSLTEYGQAVDVVDIFRPSEAVPAIVAEAIALGCKVIWLQEGVGHAAAADRARAAGLKVVENRCLKKVHLSSHA
jgi:predicted CoA-binding protein